MQRLWTPGHPSLWWNWPRSSSYRVVLLLVPALCAAVAARLSAFSKPMQGHWVYAWDLANHGRMTEHFIPIGYAEFLAMGIRLFPAHPVDGAITMQILLQVVISLLIWALLRSLAVSPGKALWGALLLQLHPELIVSVTKIWDVPFSTALFLAIVLSTLSWVRHPDSNRALIVCGYALGLGTLERPNFVLFIPVILLVYLRAGRTGDTQMRLAKKVSRLAVVVVLAMGFYSAGTYVAYRHFEMPHNGPYNLFAGQNPYAEEALLRHLNAEPSIPAGLAAAGFPMQGDVETQRDSVGPLYTLLAERFMVQHPVEEVRLVGVKLYTLFRPDTKVHRLLSVSGMIKLVLALPALLWICVVLYLCFYAREFLTREDGIIFLFAGCYLVPFLLTNADPRFRTPLDLLFLIQLLAFLDRWHHFRRGECGRLDDTVARVA